jgi:hypothetical protein
MHTTARLTNPPSFHPGPMAWNLLYGASSTCYIVKDCTGCRAFFKNSSVREGGGGGGCLQKRTILYIYYWVWWDNRWCWWHKIRCGVVCNSMGVWVYSPPENVCIFPPLGLHFVRFLKQIFGYTVLHKYYTVDRLNLQLI